MAQTQALTRRIRSVKNARQITKALEVVAASRMRRVVEAVERARQYGQMADDIMRRIAGNPEAGQQAFFAATPDSQASLYIIFTSDRGQAGAFNSNVFHLALAQLREEKIKPQIVVFGRKGARFFSKFHNAELVGAYEGIEDVPDVNVFAPLAEMLNDRLAAGSLGRVIVVYTQFLSSLSQKASSFQLLPIDCQAEGQAVDSTVYEFEPDIKDVMPEAIRLFFEARLLQARIESAAAEQAMRMVAMGNATKNANELIEDLTLELNATRQAAITQEIAEITGGAEAIAV